MAREDPADLALAKAEPKSPAGRAAAGRVLTAHRGLIKQLCLGMVRAGYELDDLIQEAHLAGLDALRYFDPARGVQFQTYLAECVRRRLGGMLGDRRQRPLPQEGEDETPDLLAAIEAVDRTWLAGVLEKLPPLERAALELKYGLQGGGELTTGEVGKRLGVGEESAGWLIWQGQLGIKYQGEGE
ncbi:MAG TPA: sigma-70 family RNA polymerase sigma factor [bacterium]|nr:sigma-70 family RNA polymerase sigma factor [bacterium]